MKIPHRKLFVMMLIKSISIKTNEAIDKEFVQSWDFEWLFGIRFVIEF
jgi:hypothetical protein